MKHIYIITRGEYSDYGILGLISTFAPVEDWPAVRKRIAAVLDETIPPGKWFVDDEAIVELVARACDGAVLHYEEQQITARRGYGDSGGFAPWLVLDK